MENKYDIEKYLKIWDETEKGLEIIVNSNFELKEIDGSFYIINKKYPKTYIECAKILDCFSAVHIDGYKSELLEKFQELLIARNAYWKMAGDELGLSKSWEPDWKNLEQEKYCIWVDNGNIVLRDGYKFQHILCFPTKEMIDIFYENFKDLIETCKELL